MTDAGGRTARRALVGVLALLGLVAASCARERDDGARDEVVVFAAASLTGAFTELGAAFARANPDSSATFNFAGSSELVAQIIEGAPADVFASADLDNMARLTGADAAAGEPVVVATNRSEIVVAAGNPLGITGVEDLTDDDLIVVTCAPEVPCGAYATQIFDNAGVTVIPDSYEDNVKAVVTKVTLGEADAGIAYATDVTAAGDDADGVEIPAELNVLARYPIVGTADAPNPDGAQAFIEFALSDPGQTILADFGFGSP
jgi:molybdate transport system substrate-binding protein